MRLVAFIGNDPDRLRCALHAGRRHLVAEANDPATAAVDGWGAGFYQGGEVLLRRRPKPPSSPVDLLELAREIRTDTLIAHLRTSEYGAARSDNTPPFRFRAWLGAPHGELPARERLQPLLDRALPELLRRNIRGETVGEQLFHLFLAAVHEQGQLDDPLLPHGVAAEALAMTAREVLAVGGSSTRIALAVTNGRILLALRAGVPMHVLRLSGVRDCPVCREDSGLVQDSRGARRAINHDLLRAVTIIADAVPPVEPPWEAVPDQHIVVVSHQLAVELRPL